MKIECSDAMLAALRAEYNDEAPPPEAENAFAGNLKKTQFFKLKTRIRERARSVIQNNVFSKQPNNKVNHFITMILKWNESQALLKTN